MDEQNKTSVPSVHSVDKKLLFEEETHALRDKPNIKWDKDRGKDVASAPWYHQFNGDRINDHHLTLAEKRKVSTENTDGTENG